MWVADGDYIAARMACRAQLPVQFLWASQQALEKYLKCILFLHRIPATGVRHDLRRALELIANVGLKLDLNEHSLKFIQDVDDVGQYRYMEASFHVNWQRLIILDRCVWELRRFCTLCPAQRAEKLVEGQMPPRIRLGDSSFMEKVLDDKNIQDARRYCGRTDSSVGVVVLSACAGASSDGTRQCSKLLT